MAETWEKPIELLWIDGDHSFQSVKRDFEIFFPHVVEGGIIAFHDSTSFDVQKVVLQVFKSSAFDQVGLVSSITWGRKSNPNSLSFLMKTKKNAILSLNSSLHLFRKFPGFRMAKNLYEKI